jgi:hypothetical protein
MVGVINNALDGDGIGNDAFGLTGDFVDRTGYGGPNAHFHHMQFAGPAGIATFIAPIPPNGGTGYFALEDSLGDAFTCRQVINDGTLDVTLISPGIHASYTTKPGYTLDSVAQLCGFIALDWQQWIEEWPLPSDLRQRVTAKLLYAPGRFEDPPPHGYTYQGAESEDQSNPFYYDPRNNTTTPFASTLASAQSSNDTLTFYDRPSDCCLGSCACGGTPPPPGSQMVFTTHLVGVNQDFTATDLGIGFEWYSTFDGHDGGIFTKSSDRSGPGNGTGGVGIVGVQRQTS